MRYVLEQNVSWVFSLDQYLAGDQLIEEMSLPYFLGLDKVIRTYRLINIFQPVIAQHASVLTPAKGI